jgi:hypothetical protein
MVPCPVMFIDDLISPDVDFWSKHIAQYLDQRVKNRELVTIVASMHPPTVFGAPWSAGFKHDFSIIRLGNGER